MFGGEKMKKVHLYTCFILWGLWLIGVLLVGLNILIVICIGDVPFLFFNIVYPYNLLLLLLSLIPIEPIMFIIALILEIPKWTKKSFLTVVLPFIITFVMWNAYIAVFILGTGGV